MIERRHGALLRAALWRGGLLTLTWWALAGDLTSSLAFGVPAVLLALVVSLAVIPRAPWSVTGALAFAPRFLAQSLRGGVDVAWRALHPRLPIEPALLEVRLGLPPGLPRVFLANTVSLLPGTLSADLDGDRLTLHVLDRRGDPRADLAALERSIARVFRATASTP